MLAPSQRSRFQAAHAVGKRRTTERLTAFSLAYWNGLPDYSAASVDRYLETVVPRILAGRAQVAASTAVYLARVAEIEPVAPVDVVNIRGTDDVEVYTRPAKTLSRSLDADQPLSAAVAAGASHLASLVSTDMQIAQQHQTAETTARSPVFEGGFKRVLTGRENCAKCYIASTQRYHRENLMPIHPGCDCGVEPLAAGENVGQVIDPDRLEHTHDWVKGFTGGDSDRGARFLNDATGDNPAGDYADLMITRNHGEYGPTLSWRHQRFTGPADI